MLPGTSECISLDKHPKAVVVVEYSEIIRLVLVPAIREIAGILYNCYWTITCMIFAGATFNLIHESWMIWASRNFDTMDALPLFTRWHSLSNMSTIVHQPNCWPSRVNFFVLPGWDEWRVLSRFSTKYMICAIIEIFRLFFYPMAWTNQPVNQIRRINKIWPNFVLVSLFTVDIVCSWVPMRWLHQSQVGCCSITNK